MAPLQIRNIEREREINPFFNNIVNLKITLFPSDPIIKLKRKEKKFNVIRHLFLKDNTGKTKGCGCIKCKTLHAAYKEQVRLESIKYKIHKYRKENCITLRPFSVKNKSIRLDPTPSSRYSPYSKQIREYQDNLYRKSSNKIKILQRGANSYDIILGIAV